MFQKRVYFIDRKDGQPYALPVSRQPQENVDHRGLTRCTLEAYRYARSQQYTPRPLRLPETQPEIDVRVAEQMLRAVTQDYLRKARFAGW